MKRIYLASIATLLLCSCKDKNQEDVKPPVIVSVKINDNTSSNHLIMAPTTVILKVNATDNFELNQLKVGIDASDFQSISSNLGPNTGSFGFHEIASLNGTSSEKEFEIELPDSIAGNWTLRVDVSDDVGYLATSYTGNINIDNAQLPQITATTTPAIVDGMIQMTPNTNLYVSGSATDMDVLASIQVRLESLQGVLVGTPVDIPLGTNETSLSFTPNFDNAQTGHYMLVIEAKDLLGYKRKWGTHVVVSE